MCTLSALLIIRELSDCARQKKTFTFFALLSETTRTSIVVKVHEALFFTHLIRFLKQIYDDESGLRSAYQCGILFKPPIKAVKCSIDVSFFLLAPPNVTEAKKGGGKAIFNQ